MAGSETVSERTVPVTFGAWGQKEEGRDAVQVCVGGGSCAKLAPYNKLLFPVHIQANLEDELVKEALKTVRLSTS